MNAVTTLAALALAVASFVGFGASLPAAAAVAPAPSATTWVVTARHTLAGAGDIARSATDWVDSLGTQLVIAELGPTGVAALGRHVHESEGRCAGFFGFPTREEAEGFIANGQAARAIALPMGGMYTIDNQATVDPWLLQVDHTNIYDTIASLSSFHNRFYSSSYGHDAAVWIRDAWQALAAGRSDVHLELVNCASCSTQPSVVMTVDGHDLADEVVVIGAHLDSINTDWGNPYDPEQLSPGADDDASGIAIVSEIIRIAMASGWQPQRTVKFMGYAAEELGLYGSTAIADQYYAAGVNVVGVLQLDMTNYKATVPYDMRFITDYANADLLAYFGELFDFYLAPRGYSRGELICGYGCSDHASWTHKGYAAAALTEAGRVPVGPGDMGEFPYIHTANDTLAYMGDTAAPSGPFAEFGLAFLGELAKTHGDRIFADGFEP